MKSYRVAAERLPDYSQGLVRILGLVAVTVFIASAWVIWNAGNVSYQTRRWTALAVAVVVGSAIVLSYSTAFLNGRRLLKLSLEYLLDNDAIILRREGWPDIRLPRTEIVRVLEHPRRGLMVIGGSPEVGLQIPPEISDFSELRSELLRGRSPTPWPVFPRDVGLWPWLLLVHALVMIIILLVILRFAIMKR
jgi:hypothetical protein